MHHTMSYVAVKLASWKKAASGLGGLVHHPARGRHTQTGQV